VGQRSILVGLDGERLDVMEKGLTKIRDFLPYFFTEPNGRS